MTIPRHITTFLDSQRVPYRHMTHPPRYTAQETAEAQHISGDELAKTVMVVADGRMIMAVVPASHRVDLKRLARLVHANAIRLAEEKEFKSLFGGCEAGAMPPFGNLYDQEVWLDASLEDNPFIIFNAGTHTDTIQMNLIDFERIVHPHLGRFADGSEEGVF